MTVSKAQQKATAKYVKNNYDRIEIKVSKGKNHFHADGLHSGGCGVGDARSGADALRYFEYSGQRILHNIEL